MNYDNCESNEALKALWKVGILGACASRLIIRLRVKEADFLSRGDVRARPERTREGSDDDDTQDARSCRYIGKTFFFTCTHTHTHFSRRAGNYGGRGQQRDAAGERVRQDQGGRAARRVQGPAQNDLLRLQSRRSGQSVWHCALYMDQFLRFFFSVYT